jgi:class 3 adenylate cyclase
VLAAPLEDVLGRPVPLGDGRPALVFYANRDTREPLRNHAFDLAYQVRERRPVVVVRVDLRDVPAVFRGVALRQLRRSHHASLRAMADVFRRHGEAPPEGLEGSLFLVAEPDGAPHAALGLAPGFSSALGQAVGPTGEELARADFPAHASELASALEGLAHR